MNDRSKKMMGTATSRRKLIGAAAWSAPVIVLAVAAPVASASNVVVLPVQTTNLHFVSVGWNDGANGNNALGSGANRYYGKNASLFFDTTYTNNGFSMITGIAFSSSLEKTPHDFVTNPPVTNAIYKGKAIELSSVLPRYDQDNLGLRWVYRSVFSALTLAPGESIIFRTRYRTTTASGVNATAAPYGTAGVTSAVPTDSVHTASQVETTTADNSGGVGNPYTVRT